MLERKNNKLKKCDVDELIRIRRKYWETGDTDFLHASDKFSIPMSVDCFESNIYDTAFTDLIDSCIKLNIHCSNEKIYEVFKILGFEICEEESEKE